MSTSTGVASNNRLHLATEPVGLLPNGLPVRKNRVALCIFCKNSLGDNPFRCLSCGKTQIAKSGASSTGEKNDSPIGPGRVQFSPAPAAYPREDGFIGLAQRRTRFLAKIVDIFVLIGVMWVVLNLFYRDDVVFTLFSNENTARVNSNHTSAVHILGSLMSLVGFSLLFNLLIQGFFLARKSQTIGKMLLRIKIIKTDDTQIGFIPLVAKRSLSVWAISYIPVIGPWLIVLDVLLIFRSDKRCLHDLLAGTKVVQLG